MDPGNFATNIEAGSSSGYLLLWVVLVSNLIVVLIQSMPAKLELATGKNSPELCKLGHTLSLLDATSLAEGETEDFGTSHRSVRPMGVTR